MVRQTGDRIYNEILEDRGTSIQEIRERLQSATNRQQKVKSKQCKQTDRLMNDYIQATKTEMLNGPLRTPPAQQEAQNETKFHRDRPPYC